MKDDGCAYACLRRMLKTMLIEWIVSAVFLGQLPGSKVAQVDAFHLQ